MRDIYFEEYWKKRFNWAIIILLAVDLKNKIDIQFSNV